MILYIDTREQKPLEFVEGKMFDKIIRQTLNYGDYACSHSIGSKTFPIVFERKSKGDLFGTMTKGYKRFKEEMGRAKADNAWLFLVIEGRESDIAKGYKHSRVDGLTILKTVYTLLVKYKLIPIFCKDRESMIFVIEQIFSAWDRNFDYEMPSLS